MVTECFVKSIACQSLFTLRGSSIKYSPAAQIPADHTSSNDEMQKNVIDCPISSHDPATKRSPSQIRR
jgi:hypothetical protein